MNDDTFNFTDYFKGQLDHEEEKQLFRDLAFDDELRLRFNDYLHIDKALGASLNSFSAPAALSKSVFDAVGVARIPASNATQNLARVAGKFTPFAKGLLSGIAGIVLPLLGIFYIWQSDTYNTAEEICDIPAFTTIMSDTTDEKPILKVQPKVIPAPGHNGHTRRYEQQMQTELKQPEPENNIKPLILAESNCSVRQSQPDILTKRDELELSRYKEIINRTDSQSIEITNKPQTSLLSGFSLQFSGHASWNMPEETIYPSRISKLHNMGFTIDYQLGEDFSIGLALRQETFFAKYDGTDSLGARLMYEQQPNLSSYGITMKFNALHQNAFLATIGAEAAVNYYGYIGRLALGLEYSLYENIAFAAALEYSYMYFWHQGNWFGAEKAGINYGLIYSF